MRGHGIGRGRLVPAEVEPVPEVAPELGVPGDVRHDADLEDGDEARDLEEARGADGVRAVDGREAIGEGRERVAAPVNVPGEVGPGRVVIWPRKASWEIWPCLSLM